MRHVTTRRSIVRRWGQVAACAVAVLGGAAGCGDGESGFPRAPAKAVPDRVSIQGGEIMLGHAHGSLRQKAKLDGYSITETLVTVSQYRQCVDAGVCEAPARTEAPSIWKTTYSHAAKAQRLPMVGISDGAAARYCRWVGGKLPTYPQWQMGAAPLDPRLTV